MFDFNITNSYLECFFFFLADNHNFCRHRLDLFYSCRFLLLPWIGGLSFCLPLMVLFAYLTLLTLCPLILNPDSVSSSPSTWLKILKVYITSVKRYLHYVLFLFVYLLKSFSIRMQCKLCIISTSFRK